MYLKRLTISNYKSFFEPKVFEFEPGFNVLLGANSSGKSSVLEAISFHDLSNTPHRSILNVIDVGTPLADAPASALSFITTIQELCKHVLPSQDLFVGLGDQKSLLYTEDVQILGERLKNERLVLDINADQNIGRFMRLSFENSPSMWRQQHSSGAPFPALHVRSADVSAIQVSTFSVGSPDIDQLSSRLIPKIYKFSSERSVQHVYGHHPDSELLPSSANLAYCINHLQSSNPDLADELNRLLHRVFPTIHWVGAPGNPSSQFELKVHTNPSHMKRSDLAIPINRVGTGVANALAMLYVALTAQTQRFILLEEPNSFLHPRALRELLAILAEIGNKHQFFVTTHSSDVLRTINASTVTLLEHDGCQTTVKQTSGKALHTFHAGLVDLGIRLTDLHGCDKVLWVEGETEEAIFPLLLKHFFPELAQGIAVLPLHATGDFESKKYEPKKVAAIYKKLSEGSFLAPPMVAVALDKERRSNSEVKQVEKDCAGIVHFLPRTMLEDYLLDVDGITAVLSQELERQILRMDVEQALADARVSESCLLNPLNKSSKTIHAAKVLESVFYGIGKLEYRKTAHGPTIAEWILANKPDDLRELKDWFSKFLR
jgi:AAA ATPase domain/RecF/RecN/SMC N terminal domain